MLKMLVDKLSRNHRITLKLAHQRWRLHWILSMFVIRVLLGITNAQKEWAVPT